MRRKKIKFSPKLQSSSLDDIKRFVPKNALDTSVISNYNTLPTSYQKGGLPKYQIAGVKKPLHKIPLKNKYATPDESYVAPTPHPQLSQIKTKEEYQEEERKRREEIRDLNPLNWRKNISDINTTTGYGLDFQDFIDQAIYPRPMKSRGPIVDAEANAFKVYMGQEQIGKNRFEPSPWKEGAYHLPKYAKEFPDHLDMPDEWFERAGHWSDIPGRGLGKEDSDFTGPTIKPYSDLVFGRHGVKKVPTKDGGFYLQYNDEWDLDAKELNIMNDDVKGTEFMQAMFGLDKDSAQEKWKKGKENLVGAAQSLESVIFNPFPVEGRVYYDKDNNKITGKPLTFGGNNRATPLTEFKNGGLPKYQNAGVPTRLDSTILLQNNKILADLIAKGTKDVKFLETSSSSQADDMYNSQLLTREGWSEDSQGLVDALNYEKKNLDPNSSPPTRKGNLVGAKDWWQGGGDDDDFPTTYRHRFIDPQGEAELTALPRDGSHEANSRKVHIYTYDDLAITPFDMLTPEQKKMRVEKYGSKGVPDSYIKNQTSPTPTTSTRFPPPGNWWNKIDPMEQVPVKKPGQLQVNPLQEDRLTPTAIAPSIEFPETTRYTAAEMPMVDTKARREGRIGNTVVPRGDFNKGDNKGRVEILQNGGVPRYQTGGAVVTDYDKTWDYKKEDGVVYTKRKDADKWISPKVGSVAELAIQSKVFGSPSELEKAVQMPIPEAPELNIAPPQAIEDTIPEVAPLPIEEVPETPPQGMVPDLSMPDIDMPDLSLSEKLLQAQGMLGSLWEDAKDVGEGIIDDVASAGSTVSTFLQDTVEDINEEVTDAIKFKKEAEETVAAKSQQISNYLSDIFTPDSEEAEPISPEQAPAKKSRTEAFAEMLRGSVPDMPELTGSPVDALMNPIGLSVGLPVAGAMGLYDKLKGIEIPDLPDVSMPDVSVPKVSLPDMPDISMPDMPDVGEFTGYAKEVISDAVESGQSSLSDLKNFFKGELIDYAKDFKETGENIKEGIDSAIDAAKDLPELLSSIADVEKEVKKERGDSGAPGPPPEVEPDLVLSPEDAAPKETFEEMLVNAAAGLQSGHILADDVMYRIEDGEITKKMETIVGKHTRRQAGQPPTLSYSTTYEKYWYNKDGSLRKFETPEGIKTGPEIKEEGLFRKYGGNTPTGIYEFTDIPLKKYKGKGYSAYLQALPGTPENFDWTYFENEKGEKDRIGSFMGYHPFPEKLKAQRSEALERLDISNELSAGCLQNSECDNRDMGILLKSNPSMADTLVILNADMGDYSAAAIDDLAKRFDSAESEKEKSGVLQKLLALSTPD